MPATWTGLAAVAALIGIAYRDVVFRGRTFSAALYEVGTNGFLPPQGAPQLPLKDVRIDLGASAWQFEPWAQVVHKAFSRGELALWNPYQGGGSPLAANMQSAVFDPLLLAVHLHPSPLVWDISFLGALALGAWLGFIYFRALSLGLPASLVGSAVFILSGFFFLYSNDQFFRAYLFIPPLLILVDRVISRSRLRWIALLAAAVASNLFIGMPEASIAVLGLTTGYAVYRVFTARASGSGARAAALRLAASFALACCLAAPLLILFFQYVSVAYTQHDTGGAIGLRTEPARLLLLWAVPLANGRLLTNVSATRNWIGVGALVLAVFALSSAAEIRRRPVPFFAFVIAIVMLKAYDFPFIQFVGKLPIASQTNFPGFVMPICGFCFAALAASGVQAIAERTWCTWAVFAGLLLGGIGAAWLINADVSSLATLPANYVLKPFGLAVFAAGAVLVAALGLAPALAKWVVAGVVVAELLFLVPHGFYAPRVDPYTPPAWLAAVGYGKPPTTDRVFGLEAKLFPDIAGAYGIQDIRALDALYPARYVKYITTFLQPDFGSRFVGGAYSQPEGLAQPSIVDNPMADALGVKYIISGTSLPDEPFMSAVFRQRPANASLRPAIFNLSGDRRTVLVEAPGQRVLLPVDTPEPRRIIFSYGMDDAAFAGTADDGVVFVLDGIAKDRRRVQLWNRRYIPRADPATPAFRSADVAISPALGPTLAAIELRVEPRGNSRTDQAGWNDIRVLSAAEGAATAQPIRLVASSKQATVYENPGALPRAFIAQRIMYVNDMAQAVRTLSADEPRFANGAVRVTRFNPQRDAVVEGSPVTPTSSDACGPGSGAATVTSYHAEEVMINVDAPCGGLLVLTDTYYPGWVATVNGRTAAIRPTDILFRGVSVGHGHSAVVFRYRPTNLRIGVALAAGGAVSLAGAGVWRRSRRRNKRAHRPPFVRGRQKRAVQ